MEDDKADAPSLKKSPPRAAVFNRERRDDSELQHHQAAAFKAVGAKTKNERFMRMLHRAGSNQCLFCEPGDLAPDATGEGEKQTRHRTRPIPRSDETGSDRDETARIGTNRRPEPVINALVSRGWRRGIGG